MGPSSGPLLDSGGVGSMGPLFVYARVSFKEPRVWTVEKSKAPTLSPENQLSLGLISLIWPGGIP